MSYHAAFTKLSASSVYMMNHLSFLAAMLEADMSELFKEITQTNFYLFAYRSAAMLGADMSELFKEITQTNFYLFAYRSAAKPQVDWVFSFHKITC